MSLANTCLWLKVPWMSLIALYGSPEPSNTSNHSCVDFVFVIDSIKESSNSRCATRWVLMLNLASVFHSGWPRPSHIRPKRRSLPPPNKISPSLVLYDRYGTIEAKTDQHLHHIHGYRLDVRCAVPHRPSSFCPLINALLARLDSVATWQSLKATSICWPLPDLPLAIKAAIMLLLVYNPVVKSVTATPTLTGGPSRDPVMCINPISASTITSYPARFEYGPVWPYPVIEAYISPGFILRRVS
jgi:hypothetical protein